MLTERRPVVVRIAVASTIALAYAFLFAPADGRSGTVTDRQRSGEDNGPQLGGSVVGSTTSCPSSPNTTIIPEDCFSPCRLTIRLDAAVSVGALQFRADYSEANKGFLGDGTAVACTRLAGDFSAFNHKPEEQALDGAIVSIAGVDGPLDVAVCDLEACPEPLVGDIAVFPTDASGPDLVAIFPLPAMSGTVKCSFGGTTTTLPSPVCGAPETGRTPPVTTDVLRILRAAVGLDACDLCNCDVDSNGSVDARDARRALLASLDLGGELNCPGC